jgi:hypothetical protein
MPWKLGECPLQGKLPSVFVAPTHHFLKCLIINPLPPVKTPFFAKASNNSNKTAHSDETIAYLYLTTLSSFIHAHNLNSPEVNYYGKEKG